MPKIIKLVSQAISFIRRDAVNQAAALCYRLDDGNAKVLLITSRDTGRWVLPRGNIEIGERAHACARREAFEEAGAKGKVERRSLGYYALHKIERPEPLSVSVYPLAVKSMERQFKEKGVRRQLWTSPEIAASLVDEPELKTILRHFAMNFNGSLYGQNQNHKK